MAEFMQESIAFLVRVQCRRKESSRSLSHLLMSFLSFSANNLYGRKSISAAAKNDRPYRRATPTFGAYEC